MKNTPEKKFKRGDVFNLYIPKLDLKQLSRPSFIMEGNHMVVVLHDSNHCGYNQKQVNVVPISTAESAKKTGNLIPSHIPLKKGSYDFITKDCFICTHQSIPINRSWLLGASPKGALKKKHIKKMDLGLMHSAGLLETLLEITEISISKIKTEKQDSKKQPFHYKESFKSAFLISSLAKKRKKKK